MTEDNGSDNPLKEAQIDTARDAETEQERKAAYTKATDRIYERLDNARTAGVSIDIDRKTKPTSPFREGRQLSSDELQVLEDEITNVRKLAQDASSEKSSPEGIPYLEASLPDVTIQSPVPGNEQSRIFVTGDIKFLFTEEGKKNSVRIIDENNYRFLRVDIKFPTVDDNLGLPYISDEPLSHSPEEDIMIAKYALTRAKTALS